MASAEKVDRIVIDALQVPAELSGVGREVAWMGEDLAASGVETEIVLRAPRDVAPTLARSFGPGVRLETPIARSRPRWRRIGYQQLVAPLRDGSTTTLVCPGDQAPLWGRARVVLAINDLRRLVQPATAGLFERLFYRVVQPASVRRAKAIVTLSEFMAGELQRRLRPTAPVVVAAAHPVAPAEQREAQEAPGRDVLLVGALRGYKGVEDAIEALARVDEALVHHLLLIGSEERRGASIRAHAAAHGVGERVRLCGWVSEADLEDRYRTALAVIAPSRYEGYGLPLAEAIVRGLPVIASRIPPHVEVAADAALWFEPGDVEGLASALDEIAADPERRERLAARARERGRELARLRRGWGWAITEALRLSDAAETEPRKRPLAGVPSRSG